MALHDRIEYLREEHEKLLDLAGKIEKALASASKKEFAEHLKSLTELRSLEHGLAGIVEHCHAGDRIVESTYHRYLQPDERARVDGEHEQILRLVANFREELKFATADRTMAMILPGMDVVKWLRAHIAYEKKLLERVVQLGKPPQRVAGKEKTAGGARQKTRKHIVKRKMRPKATHVVPYTLEPHPEL